MFDSSSRTRVRGLVLAAVCAAALGLAACGDDDDDDAPATEATTTEAESTTDTETTEDTTAEDTTEDPAEDEAEPAESEDAVDQNDDIADLLRSQLEAAGVPADQADCVIDELESTLSEETLEELRSATTPPQEVIDASTAAAQKCLQP